MEKAIKARGIDINTYVPVNVNSYSEKDKQRNLPKHITVSQVFTQVDRLLFYKKQSKIKKDFNKRFLFDSSANNILHAHSLFSNGYIAYSNFKENKIPYIVTVRNTDLNLFFKYMVHLRGLGNRILLNATKVTFLSQSYKDKCIEKYVSDEHKELIREKSIVIPNGIDKYWFENMNTNVTKPSKEIRAIFVGHISKSKNILKLVEACELIKSKGLDISLTIAGKVQNKRIYNKIRNNKLIDYKGILPKHELLTIYRNSNVFVLPSIRETFGLVYAEAMSQGLPVIYTQGQGFDKQFADGVVGYPIHSYNAKDIAEKIIKAKENHKALSKNALRNVSKFKWDEISKVYEEIYKNINLTK